MTREMTKGDFNISGYKMHRLGRFLGFEIYLKVPEVATKRQLQAFTKFYDDFIEAVEKTFNTTKR